MVLHYHLKCSNLIILFSFDFNNLMQFEFVYLQAFVYLPDDKEPAKSKEVFTGVKKKVQFFPGVTYCEFMFTQVLHR